ncbi:MAG: hypothetical protein R6W68_10410 [Ignavibacteriaceae bacterium]
MQRKKKLSSEFISKLAELAGGVLQSAQFDKIISLLDKEIKLHYFTASSESNLIRIIENQFDRIFFLKECLNYPHHIEVLVNLASNSNYLADILVRNPEYFFIITNPDKLKTPLNEQEYFNLISDSVNRFKTYEGKVNALRNLKRRELLRIGIADIYLKGNLERITTELSLLAKSITAVLFDLCYEQILDKHIIKNVSNKYCLIALGKLGGGELNYSSDIDLIVFTSKNSFIDKRIYYNQLITETVQLFIEQSSSLSSKGFLYRVDFRLRPDGRNAPLCDSINQYQNYYELRGEDWERQMLIKSGFIGGSNNLYKRFYSYIEKFIYPSSFSVSPLQQIRKLKSNIEKRIAGDENIKLIPGGIRDIEFSVQALQLLNGGKNKSIQTGNTLSAIKGLYNSGLLSDNESITLTGAYIYYRKIEHFLQLMNNAQTHTIPESGELPEKISHYLGFKTSAEFRHKLKYYRKAVLEIYHSITGADEIKSDSDFNRINFSDKKRALDNYNFLQYGKGIFGSKKFDNTTTLLFENIINDLFRYLEKSISPDLVIENFVRIIRSATFPKIWYKEFEDKNYFKLFLLLCEFSQYSINLFAEDKYLRDLFLSRKCFSKIDKRYFPVLSTKEILFILSFQYTSGMITADNVNSLLSDFLIAKIDASVRIFSKDKKWKNDFIVIAMGSLGAEEITFKSDIDLIFVVDGMNKYPRIQNEFQELLIGIKKALAPFEVDCRLRPEGQSSQLVWDLNKYSDYLVARARIWELQAFLKVNLIFGNKKLFNTLLSKYVEVVKSIDINDIKIEMLAMHKKLITSDNYSDSVNIKKCPGGLTEAEFVISYILLTDSKLDYKFMAGRGRISTNILSLVRQNKNDLEILVTNFRLLKSIDLANQNIFDIKTSRIPADTVKLKMLAIYLGYKDHKSFLNELNGMIIKNSKVFERIFKV